MIKPSYVFLIGCFVFMLIFLFVLSFKKQQFKKESFEKDTTTNHIFKDTIYEPIKYVEPNDLY